jgi:hypothetical protein
MEIKDTDLDIDLPLGNILPGLYGDVKLESL